MTEHEIERASTTEGLPVSPSMGPTLERAAAPVQPSLVDGRVVLICAVAIAIAVAAGYVAQVLVHLIAFVTHLAFAQRISVDVAGADPAAHGLGAWVIVVPVVGGLIVGLMARYG